MNLSKLINVTLILCILLLLPLLRPPVNVDLIPFQEEFLIVNLHGNSVHVTSDTDKPVGLNVSYMDSRSKELIQIVQTFFISSYDFDLPQNYQGNFLFVLSSTAITEITIGSRGINYYDLGIIGIIVFFKLVISVKNRFTISLEY